MEYSLLSGTTARTNHEKGGRKTRPFLRSIIALFLTVIFPGLGQAYNRQPRKAIYIAASFPVILLASGISHLMHTFAGLLIHIIIVSGLSLYALADAAKYGWRRVPEPPIKHSSIAFSILLFLMLFNSVAWITDLFMDEFLGVKAFRLTASSMEPTLVAKEGVLVDTRYFRDHNPVRNDVVVIRHDDVLTIKRIVAMSGDEISGDAQKVSVNGKTLSEKYSMSRNDSDNQVFENKDERMKFGPTRIPDGFVFVMGDNREQSYDSRHFGPVSRDLVKGKPLFIYYSRDPSRIGQKIK